MKNKLIPVILTAALTSVMTLFVAAHFNHNVPYFTSVSAPKSSPVNYASYGNNATSSAGAPVNFEAAAEGSVKAVVHIKTTTKARMVAQQNPFSALFGDSYAVQPPQMGSGSGVVISPDGYIVTNNHVVADANEVTVTFNNRYTATAKVIGTDPATDIAVLKVEDGKDLPYMEFGNSDDVKLGQWVLAVGYPLTLDATVTAGIVSAKSRSIGINRQQSASAIESFIQTDAAVNPGNSGGALVNTSGQLIGINSAIASPTGSYAGYSYAIPANIVRKAVNDLMKYGSVQRGYIGIQFLDSRTATPQQLTELHIDRNNGVYVMGVVANGGAAKAGIKKGDFITKINGVDIVNESQMQEQIARYQPGDNLAVTYTRDGKEASSNVQLTNLSGTTAILKNESSMKLLGASFHQLSDAEKGKYDIDGGVVVDDPGTGILGKQTQIHKGFVITVINDQPIGSVNDLQQVLAGNTTLQIAGFYPGANGMYYYGLSNTAGGMGNE